MKRIGLISGFCTATVLLAFLTGEKPPLLQHANAAEPALNPEVGALQLEVSRLKSIATDQSPVMKDVAYHFGNLWFAGDKANWPLAEFYWSETRAHLRWAVRVIPVRKNPEGKEIKLQEILEPIEKSALEDVHRAITGKNGEQFRAAYKQMIESCYSCHVAAGKPFLRLHVPATPPEPLIQFEPQK